MLDASYRSAYRAAHFLLRNYWRVRRPLTRGALAAVWHDGRLLIVENSYRRFRTLPGGYVHADESPKTAAARELEEEVGVTIEPARLRYSWGGMRPFEHRKDYLDIYEIEVDREPDVQVDRREIVWAGFATPGAIRRMNIVPHLRDYLDERAER